MPYYVYRVYDAPLRRVEPLGEFARYPDASRFAKAKRAELHEAAGAVRIVFAAHALQAEETLMNPQPVPPRVGDDY